MRIESGCSSSLNSKRFMTMRTLGDIILPDSPVDFTGYLNLIEDEKRNTTLFSHNFTEENAKLEFELRNLSLEAKEIEKNTVKMRGEADKLSDLCTERIKELEIITSTKKELEILIKDIEDSKSKEELQLLENAKKTLNIYKRLLKLKWLLSSKESELDAVIFNELNAYVKAVRFNKDDGHIVEKIWTAVSQACDNSWKDLLVRHAPF